MAWGMFSKGVKTMIKKRREYINLQRRIQVEGHETFLGLSEELRGVIIDEK